jgi:hypothetical protein
VTEEREPSSAVIAGVSIVYAEQPGLTLDELQARVEGLVGLFTLFQEPAVIRERRILSWPDGREIGPPHPLETLRFFAGHDI